jgi:hypothetical protein
MKASLSFVFLGVAIAAGAASAASDVPAFKRHTSSTLPLR